MGYRDNGRICLQERGGGGGGGGGGGDDQSILSSEEVKVVLNAHALDCRCDADCKELG